MGLARSDVVDWSWKNYSMDLTVKGCLQNFDTVACVRNATISLAYWVTLMLCIYKLCRLYSSSHTTAHSYIIFFVACVECLLSSVHGLFERVVQVEFVVNYLKFIQILVITHLYWTMASHALRREYLLHRLVVPFLSVLLTFFTAYVFIASLHVGISWLDCLKPYWVVFSCTELFVVQIFMLAAIFVTVRLNEIRTMDSVRKEQKIRIWLLVCVYELSAICSVAYDVMLILMADSDEGCSGVFNHKQFFYSSVLSCLIFVKFLLPLWVMLFVFSPVETHEDENSLLPSINADVDYESQPSHPRFRSMRGRGPVVPSPTPSISTSASSSVGSHLRRSGRLESINELEEGEDDCDTSPVFRS